MENWSLIGTVTILNILGAISPGPDFVMTVKNSLNQSRQAGIYTGVGIALGLGVHLVYCSVGVAYLIANSPLIFGILKYIGAIWLAYIGIQCIISKKSALDISEDKQVSVPIFQYIKTGFITNVLNPKATLFFLGLFSFVIKKETPAWVLFIISFIIILTALVWFSVVAIFFTQKRIQKAFFQYEKIINTVFGLLLFVLALRISLA